MSHVASTRQRYPYQCISNRNLESGVGGEMYRSKDQNNFLLSYFLPPSDAWPVGFSKMGDSAPFPVVVALPTHWKNGCKPVASILNNVAERHRDLVVLNEEK